MKNIKNIFLIALAVVLASCAKDVKKTDSLAVRKPPQKHLTHKREPVYLLPRDISPQWGHRTVDDILYAVAPYAIDQLRPYFREAGVSYPPREVTLIGLKEEKKLELWARDRGPYKFIRDYDVRAASGKAGPKLRQGDKQVPEGIYRVTRLNPNSNFHLSLRLDYPNDFDLMHARMEGRDNPGSDIYIHGKSVSVGCLAMGDPAIEELFVLAAHVGTENMKVIIAPHDPRVRPLDPKAPGLPSWAPDLYAQIQEELAPFSEAVKLTKAPTRTDRRLR